MPWIIGGAIVGSSLLGAGASAAAGKEQSDAANSAAQSSMNMFNRTEKNLAPWLDSGNVALSQLSRLMGLPGYSNDPATKAVNYKGGQFASKDDLYQALYDDYRRQVSDPALIDESAIRSAMNAATPVSMGGGNDPQFGQLLKPFSLQDFQESPAFQFNLQQGQKAIDKSAAARKMFYAPQTLQDISKFSQGMASNEFQNAYSNYNNNMNNIWNRLNSMSGSGQNAAVQTGGFGAGAQNNANDYLTGGAAARAAGGVGAANAITGGVGTGINTYMMNQMLQNQQMPSVPLRGIPGMTGDFGTPGYGGGVYA